ncbi:hypothetical protein GJAV_G00183490 [Gymnothorax javanicus]|nr:hypothetical protein GJAV_G00183490 [Gymnothorax javanicus]
MPCVYVLLLLSGLISLFFMDFVVGGSLEPNITIRPRTGEVIEGQNFTITCHTQNPNGTFHLEFNGSNITSPQSALNSSTSFLIEAADSSHSGNYSCVHVITSHHGDLNVSRSGMVTVNVTAPGKKLIFEFFWMLVAVGSAGGAVLLLLIVLCVCLSCKSKSTTEAVLLSTYRSQAADREEVDSEPNYMDTPSAGSRASYINVETEGFGKGCNGIDTPSEGSEENYLNVDYHDEQESGSDEDYVNTETLDKSKSPVWYGDNSESEADYENFNT